MDDGSIQKIPLLFPASQVTLVPGQTIPLSESEETAIHVLKYSVEGNHIFGFIPSSYWLVIKTAFRPSRYSVRTVFVIDIPAL